MDPRYAAPEEYIMSTQTAEPPAVPVALLLSPILWQLNLPDRFDMWAAGLILLQMCIPGLRRVIHTHACREKERECHVDRIVNARAWQNSAMLRPAADAARVFVSPWQVGQRAGGDAKGPRPQRAGRSGALSQQACLRTRALRCNSRTAAAERRDPELTGEPAHVPSSQAWRETSQKRATMRLEDQEGWDILDANDGAGWDLVQSLLKGEAVLRPSAAQVRRHPFVTGKVKIAAVVDGAVRNTLEDTSIGKQGRWVLRRMARSGTQEVGGFTEAQMEKLQALGAFFRFPTPRAAARGRRSYSPCVAQPAAMHT